MVDMLQRSVGRKSVYNAGLTVRFIRRSDAELDGDLREKCSTLLRLRRRFVVTEEGPEDGDMIAMLDPVETSPVVC
jgi:hypothetical protein